MMRQFALREWQQDDAEAVALAANNQKIAENLRNAFPYPYTLEDAKWYVNDCIARRDERQITRAIVVEGVVAGSIGVFVQTDVYEKSAELGYWLSEECWGQGIMTAAVRQISREPFAHNRGSRRVLEKAGFTCEGTMRNGVFKNGQVHSYCMYALLREP